MKNENYVVKTNTQMWSLIKKELNRFINSPVFVTNAAFGLILFLIVCILVCVKFETIVNSIIASEPSLTIEIINTYLPVILFGFICFSALTSSITSSMISLEGKSFIVLKSLPVNTFKILLSKVLTAVIIMIPILLMGDIIMFVMFPFHILEMMIMILASIVLPWVAEMIGILINLKYPKLDAENDTEIVKQSMSSMVSVFVGMFGSLTTFAILVGGIAMQFSTNCILLCALGIYIVIGLLLLLCLYKKGVKEFNNINV